MKKFKIDQVKTIVKGYHIEASSKEEAIQKFDDIEINGEGHDLPLENYYIDGSFNREEDEEAIREYYMQ